MSKSCIEDQMSLPTTAHSATLRRLTPWALILGATLGFTQLGYGQLPEYPILALMLVALGGLGVQHRPWGALGLGFGTIVLPLGVAVLGPAGAAWIALGLSLTGSLGPQPRNSIKRRRLDDLARHAAVACLVLLCDPLFQNQGPTVRVLADSSLWVLGLTGCVLFQQWIAGRRLIDPLRLVVALLIETVSLLTGLLIAIVGLQLGTAPAVLLLLGFAGLTLEADRQSQSRSRAEARVRTLERLERAGRRIVTSPPSVNGVVSPLYRECRQVLRFDWFELELHPRESTDSPEIWSANPDGIIQEGGIEVPPYPPNRPGIHRRVEWTLFEHSLSAGGEQSLASLRLWCDPRSISPDSETLLRQLVPQLGGMVFRALLGEQARRDPLTGAALRRVLDARLKESFARRRSEGGQLAVVLCDLDFFKRINDTYGHAAGDRALQAVAQVLAEGIQEDDLCARYGGEEFALILEQQSSDRTLRLVDEIRRRVDSLDIRSDDGESRLPLSLSAGIAVYPDVHCNKPSELLELSDTALYEAKRLGRNCCLLYLGSGRYQDAQGRVIDTLERGQLEVPQIFA